MVVGVTLATIYMLRRGKGGVSMLDPDGLIEALEDELENDQQRAAALEIAQSLKQVSDEWSNTLRATMDQYLQEVQQQDLGGTDLYERVFRTLEDKRRSTLTSYFELREQLRLLLPEDQWNDVLGD